MSKAYEAGKHVLVKKPLTLKAKDIAPVILSIVLDIAKIPVKKRGAEFPIMLDTKELMNSRLSGLEEALAKLACDRIKKRSKLKS